MKFKNRMSVLNYSLGPFPEQYIVSKHVFVIKPGFVKFQHFINIYNNSFHKHGVKTSETCVILCMDYYINDSSIYFSSSSLHHQNLKPPRNYFFNYYFIFIIWLLFSQIDHWVKLSFYLMLMEP